MKIPKLIKSQNEDWEIVHFHSDLLTIKSKHRRVMVKSQDRGSLNIKFPRIILDFFGFSRLLRRALRLDKCNVMPIDPFGRELILMRQGIVYKYDEAKGLRVTCRLRQSRNLLHTDFCKTKSGLLLFGEYGANTERHSIPIYASNDNGENWKIVYEISAGRAKHIHGVYADSYSDNVWIFTGDADGECWVIEASEDFAKVRHHGDGSQIYRACTVFFTPDKVVWAMDSPLQSSQTVHFDRLTGSVELYEFFPGPIWYGLEVPSRGYLLASTVEPGDSVVGDEACVYFSFDLVNWTKMTGFSKDCWPMGLFKFGVVGFSRGESRDGSFYMFGEALEGLDGKSVLCMITP